MPIVRSEIVARQAQANGREWVHEEHEDHTGTVHRRRYLGTQGDTAGQVAILAAAAVAIVAALEAAELARLLRTDAAPVFVYTTGAQMLSYLRDASRTAAAEECARLARWVIDRVNDGTVTTTQLRNAWGLTAAQWTTLQTKMQTLRANWLAVQAAVGE